MTDRADVVIVGSGAGGGPLAYALSRAGARVLVLERGPRYSRSDYEHDEVGINSALGFFVPSMKSDPHVVIDTFGNRTLSDLGWIACCVGGGTAHMGGALYRFHPCDFEVRSRFGVYHETADWPYGYEQLEPYYCKAEWGLGVSGHGLRSRFEGWRSRDLPLGPLETHPLAAALDRACQNLGLSPYYTPRAINSIPFDGRPACSYCDRCGSFGCPTGARGSTQETFLAKAEATGYCEVRPNCTVVTIPTSPLGRATGAIYIDKSGEQHRANGSVVCVCCSAIESARLLLLSASRYFPDGLANRSGMVGRFLQFLSVTGLRARFEQCSMFDSPPGSRRYSLGRSLMDYYLLPEGVSDIPKGGLMRFDIIRPSLIATAQRLAVQPDGSFVWGDRLKERLKTHWRDAIEVEVDIYHDFIPNEVTYIDLDDAVVDRLGWPVARIHLGVTEHHKKVGHWLADRAATVLKIMGADAVVKTSTADIAHQLIHGTCRSGNDPTRSVLNLYCQSHDVPNLFVVDGSFMPTSAGAPSTLTIVANSLRTADFIIEQSSLL